MSDKDYSLEAFNRFLDNAAAKGYLNKNTVQSRKAAANKVFSILETSEQTDLRNVDIGSTFDRFQNLQGSQYHPDSLLVYLSRTRTAVGEFISWVDNPSAYSYKIPKTQKAVPKQKNSGGSTKTVSKATEQNRQTLNVSHTQETEQYTETKHIVVPIPLRENLIVKILNLPADLTPSEADRLAAIVKAFAVTSIG